MHRCHRLLLVAVLTLGFSGCYSHTTYQGVNPLDALTGKYQEDVVFSEKVSVWISLIEAPFYDATMIDAKCPTRSGSITKSKSFGAAMLQMVTLGIYHSITVEVGCAKAPVAISPAEVRAVVADDRFVDAIRRSDPTLADAAERAHVKANAELLASR